MSERFEGAPCAVSGDPDAWFVNKNGRLDPEEREDIEAQYAGKMGADMIAEKERINRKRLRGAIRACYFECPMATRLECLQVGLEEEFGVWGSYTAEERRQMVELRDRYQISSHRIADVVISQDRKAAFGEGDDPGDDQSPGPSQPQAQRPMHKDTGGSL